MGFPSFSENIDDQNVQDNFRKLKEFLVTETPWLGFRFFEVEFKVATAFFDFKHNLESQPQDAIITSVTNGATASFKYDSFTKDTVRLSVTDKCVVRFLAGSFK